MGREHVIILDGRKITVYFQQAIDDEGGYWATTTRQNSDVGYSLYGNREAYRDKYQPNGERESRSYRGSWDYWKPTQRWQFSSYNDGFLSEAERAIEALRLVTDEEHEVAEIHLEINGYGTALIWENAGFFNTYTFDGEKWQLDEREARYHSRTR